MKTQNNIIADDAGSVRSSIFLRTSKKKESTHKQRKTFLYIWFQFSIQLLHGYLQLPKVDKYTIELIKFFYRKEILQNSFFLILNGKHRNFRSKFKRNIEHLWKIQSNYNVVVSLDIHKTHIIGKNGDHSNHTNTYWRFRDIGLHRQM